MKPIRTIENFGLIAELYEDGSVDIKQHVGHGTYLRMHITDLATLSGLVRKVQDAWLEIKGKQMEMSAMSFSPVKPGSVEGPTMGCKPLQPFEPSFVHNPHPISTGRLSTAHPNEAIKPIIDLDPTAPPMKITADLNGPVRGRRLFEKGPELKKVGFWREARRPVGEMFHMTYGQGPIESQYPDVRDFIDPSWKRNKPEEYSAVIAYLAVGAVKDAYKGSSECRICKQSNGSCDMTEGPWVWPEGFVHYITAHHVKPPQEFIDYVVKWMAEVK